MNKIKMLFYLFFSMFKIGIFTFGGGYAMISLLESEFVSKKKLIEHDEFLDLVSIAESTPGPIAINCATYLGYKKEKVLGSIFATLGMVIPSFIIIFTISLFFDQFLSVAWVASAFKGIRVCVIFLIFSASYKMLKKIKKTIFTVLLTISTFVLMIVFSVFAINFSSIFFILICGTVGALIYAINFAKKNDSNDKNEVKK